VRLQVGVKTLAWAVGAGLAAHLLILATGRMAQAWGEYGSGAAVEYRLAEVESPPKVERRGSPHLPLNFVVVLEEGQAESWMSLVRVRRDRAGGPEPVKKLRRLRRGKPFRVMTGRSTQECPIPFPRVTRVARMLSVEATAYDPGPVNNRRGLVGTTSLGLRAHFGIVAVDPKVIPYRSRLYVEGYGPGLAGDTGGAIKGARLDLCFNSTREARLYGRRRTKVYLLEGLSARKAARILKLAGLK
jgi:3D (Asp-Asp-Asp) domain-containing protein